MPRWEPFKVDGLEAVCLCENVPFSDLWQAESSRGLASHCESASKLDGKQLSFWQEWRTRPELALERKERASIRSHQAASHLSLLDNAINAKISNTLGDA